MGSSDYRRVEAAIQYLDQQRQRQPELAEVARHVGLSAHHFQRLFSRWAGVSPKRFLQFLTLEHAKRLLAASQNVLDTSHAVGLSGPGRLHDLFVTLEAVTPGEYRQQGAGVEIRYGVHPTPFGECLLATTGRGVCALSFLGPASESEALGDLEARWPRAAFVHDRRATAPLQRQIFSGVEARSDERPSVKLHLRGTNFQLQVWRALLDIPPGATASYGQLAAALGQPAATRAVASAIGRNPVSYLIPCHRVIRATGQLGGYRWGLGRKQLMLAREAAAQSAE